MQLCFPEATKRHFEGRISVLTWAAFTSRDIHSLFISVIKLSKNNLGEHEALAILTQDICLMSSEGKMDQVPVSLLFVCSSGHLNQGSKFQFSFPLRTSLNMKLQHFSFNRFLPDVLTTVVLFSKPTQKSHSCSKFNLLKTSHHWDYIMIFLSQLITVTPVQEFIVPKPWYRTGQDTPLFASSKPKEIIVQTADTT